MFLLAPRPIAITLFLSKYNLSGLKKGSILVMDRGYCDYAWWQRLGAQGVYFVTRPHPVSAVMTVLGQHAPPDLAKGVLRDEKIRIGTYPRARLHPSPLRLVTFYDKEKHETYQFLTNNWRLSGATIADIYKHRWHIEVFFKWVKQHLKIKTFLGTSHNAVLTQVPRQQMKMVKSLLLGTAAGLVAVAGAQAADMPVRAAPVQYVKICSLYGDGFYYIPGTDICLKIGGYVRGEYAYNAGRSMTNGAFEGGSPRNGSGYKDRFDGQDFTMRTRAYALFDSRQLTEYGTLRSYLQIGVNYDSPRNTNTNFSANRAFIQFAGFTVGSGQSFFDFFSSSAVAYFDLLASDRIRRGTKVFAYTAQYGNGLSATFSFEEPRSMGRATPTSGVINTNLGNGGLVLGTIALDPDRAKARFPDIVQNWLVDQAWGSAQLMVAAHDVSGGYYAANAQALGGPLAGCVSGTANGVTTGSEVCGHPADKVGWAVGGGSSFNLYQGDYFQWQVTYAQGATRYVNHTQGFSPVQFNGSNFGYGLLSDGVFSVATGDVQLTTVWGVNAAYDHFWLSNFRTSIYGAWTRYEYGDSANLAICTAQTAFAVGAVTFTPAQVAAGACNNNFSWWQLGSRTQYNFTPWFYVGFDVIYSKIQSASNGTVAFFTPPAGVAKPATFYAIQDQDNYAFRIRVHRDIVP